MDHLRNKACWTLDRSAGALRRLGETSKPFQAWKRGSERSRREAQIFQSDKIIKYESTRKLRQNLLDAQTETVRQWRAKSPVVFGRRLIILLYTAARAADFAVGDQARLLRRAVAVLGPYR
jgi:hypothetical protein